MKSFIFWNSDTHIITRTNVWRTLVQALIIGISAVIIVLMIANYSANDIELGFGFLNDPSGYQIGQSLIEYTETDSYFKVYVVGLLNTLLATFLAIILATFLGFVVGLCLLSSNWLLSKVAVLYIEVLRNLPPLLHVLFWYVVVILKILPNYEDSINFFNIFFLNVRGLTGPEFNPTSTIWPFIIGIFILLIALILLNRHAKKRMLHGKPITVWYWNIMIIASMVILYVVLSPYTVLIPVAGKFRFTTGFTLEPELFAIVVALASYTSTYIATIVRSSILSIPKNQIEAAHSLGLNYWQRLGHVTIPLALRSMIPPLTNQYLNILKNSSLGVAIGYSEVVAVFAGTALNQTGRAIEIMFIVMATYLLLSLLTSWLMNIYNKKVINK